MGNDKAHINFCEPYPYTQKTIFILDCKTTEATRLNRLTYLMKFIFDFYDSRINKFIGPG